MGIRERLEERALLVSQRRSGLRQDLEIIEVTIKEAEILKLHTVIFMKAVYRILKVLLRDKL